MARSSKLTVWVLGALLVAICAGCESKTSSPAWNKANAEGALPPRELLDKTLAVYKGAKGYQDDGQVKLSYKQDGEPLEDSAPLSVVYAAPNRLQVKAYQTEVVCDGEHLYAQIRDVATADLDGQVVKRAAPKSFQLEELYADEVLHDALQSGLGRHPVQLELLFSEAPLVDLLKKDAKLTALPPAADNEQHQCQRIEVELADGKYVFWIDAANYVLRRIEYPVANMLPQLAAMPGVTDLKLVADFRGAKFDKAIPAAAFAFTVPEKAKAVRHFVLPPQGLPTELFGQKPADFTLATAAGEKLASTDLQGQAVVLMWFSNDPACQAGLQQLQQAITELNAGEKLAAYVVATEDQQTKSEDLAQVLKSWEVAVPLLRDFEFVGRDTFDIKNAPTLVVLDAQGQVQLYEEGVSPRLSQTLAGALKRLLAGEDLAAELVAGARKAEEQYAQNLATASGASTQTSVVEIPEAKAVEKRAPQHFAWKELWSTSSKDLTEPGNFLVYLRESESQPHVWVLDGYRTAALLNAQGEVVKKQTLDLPEGAGITFLRTATDRAGKRSIVGSSLLGKQLFVFDDQWKVTLNYPPADQPHEGIHAVEITDLGSDGTPELYVGYWSLLGIQQVTLEGKREWSNRVVPTVLSLVATPPNDLGWRKLVASGDRGVLYRLNQYGHEDPKIEVPGRQIHRLSVGNFRPEATTYCGVSYQEDGRLLVVGLNTELEEVWNYKLPSGQFNNQIEYVTNGRLCSPQQAEWIVAAPDGSVHIISDDGEFSDSFATGELLTGLACVPWGDEQVILTASKGKVTAWSLQKK